MSGRPRLAIALWLAALLLAALFATRSVKVATDLTAFLPDAASEAEALLLDELRDGAAARLILVAIEGEAADRLARLSRQLAAELRQDARFRRVENGELGEDSELQAQLLSHRYLLSPAVTADRFTAGALRAALLERLDDLASPVEVLVKDWLARDPSGEMLAILQAWQPAQGPVYRDGVWMSADESRALLMLESVAPGFDLDAQSEIVNRIETAFASLGAEPATLVMTGPGPFSVMLQAQTSREATLFGALASVLMIAVLYFAYRSWRLVLLGALPLATAGLLGMLAVQLVYGGIHGITLAFGMTLIGVANDYPLHLFSHLHPGSVPRAVAERIWPVLRLSVLATSIAYLTLVLADFAGLAQLGLFTVTALAVAAFCTRVLIPRLLPADARDCGLGWARTVEQQLEQWPVRRWPALLLLAASAAVIALHTEPLWDDELAGLTPVPAKLQKLDGDLRAALGAADLRYLGVIRAPDAQAALQRSERLAEVLAAQQAAGALGGYDLAARYLPSIARQQARQAALPEPAQLRRALAEAQRDLPFQSGLFRPFLAEVEAARQQVPLTPPAIHGSLLGLRIAPLLFERHGEWLALVSLQDVRDPAAVSAAVTAADIPGTRLFDLKVESEQMVGRFRDDALDRIVFAVAATLLVMLWGLPLRRVPAVLLPYGAAVLAVAAAFHLAGLRLNLFHLVSLMLVAGVSMDYALFLSQPETDRAERARSLHAVTLCLVSTVSVFGILGLSQIPVLRAIGSTVTLGVLLSFGLALLGARPAREDENRVS